MYDNIIPREKYGYGIHENIESNTFFCLFILFLFFYLRNGYSNV